MATGSTVESAVIDAEGLISRFGEAGYGESRLAVLDESAKDVEAERSQLLDSMRRFVESSESDPERVTLEPMLGRVSLEKWRRIHGVHSDYHLRQFGV